MAVRKIFMDGDPILRKRCREITVFDDKLSTLVDDMFETMHKEDGVGLAGPQVGMLRRIAVVDTGEDKLELINAQITDATGEQDGPEGCLSVDSSRNCNIKRPMVVTVRAFDRKGRQYEKTVVGLSARAVCHELDHLEGILFYDRKSGELK